MISEAKWKATRGEVAARRGRGLARAARLGFAAAAVLIFIVLPLQAQTETVLYSFTGGFTNGPDGSNPGANLLRDKSGNLFGTTQAGGDSGNGTVFELVNSDGSYTEKVLYSFKGSTTNDGSLPLSDLVMDSSGNLYGTTSQGGAIDGGIVFELVASNGSYTENVLYSFKGEPNGEPNGDGAGPQAGLVMDSNGNLFGTTEVGGHSSNGTVFELMNSSGNFTETVLYRFEGGDDGALPDAALIIDSHGNLYGTTSSGGTSNAGTVFELMNSSGNYTETVLYNFTGFNGDGRGPIAGVVMDTSGNLYGTTLFGGPSTACGTDKLGCGTVFKLTFSNGSYTESVLHTFTGLPGVDGALPLGLVLDSSGNLYGVTEDGGASNTSNTCAFGCGTVFELSPSAEGYTPTILYSFPTFAGDGLVPDAALVLDSSGNLYGITSSGGFATTTPSGGGQSACPGGCGTVFKVAPGKTAPTETISATSGSGQSAAINAGFSAPLVATVLNGSGTGVSGVKVTFTTPASGASGTFAGGNNTAVTSSAGTATSAAFTANATAGSYTVTASAPGVSGTASFSLMNQPGSVGTTTTINSTSSDSHGFPLPKNDALVLGPPVTVNFTVAQTSGSVAPTGTVVVKDGFGDTCTTTTLNNGVGLCSLTISQFGTGSTPITAAYTPFTGGGFTASTSSSMTENLVEVVAPCANASDVDIKTTSMMWQDTITVCLAGNEKAVPAVAIVTDCMLGFVCNPPPPTVTAVPGEANTYTVTVTGTKTSTVNGSLRDPQPRGGPWRLELFGLCGLLAMLIALQLARHHRTRLRLSCAAAVLFVLLLTGMSACTSGNSGTGNSGTPPGTYTIDVTITVGGFKVVVPVVVVVTK